MTLAAIRAFAAQAAPKSGADGRFYAAHPRGHHIWLTLPPNWTRADFAAHLQHQGLAVVTSDSFSVDDRPPQAIRVALGAARSRSQLVAALDVLAAALKSPTFASRIV